MLDKFRIGHVTDEENGTGVTVILCEDGAVGGVSVRGASPASRETELLKDGKTVQKVNAVVLSGGSAFGLEAACGVMNWLNERNLGYNAGRYNVPIVVGASLYDLEYKNFAYPKIADGYAACDAAEKENFATGSIGAGTGATVSKMTGGASAAKGGIGVATYKLNGLEIAAIVAVNALGDIVKDGKPLLAARAENGEFIDSRALFSCGGLKLTNQNTTIGAIITNARLTKEECNILADLAHDGFATAISPAHTPYDGDTMFCMASGEVEVPVNMLAGMVAAITEKAIQSVAEQQFSKTQSVNKLFYKIYKKMFRNKQKGR